MSVRATSVAVFAVCLAVSAGQALYGRDNLGVLYNYNDNMYNPLGASGLNFNNMNSMNSMNSMNMNMPGQIGGVRSLRRAGNGRQRVYRIRNVGTGLSQRDLLYDSQVTGFPAGFINNYGIGSNLGQIYDASMPSGPYDPITGLMYRAPLNSASHVGSLLV